jgi:hypothetical protein
MLQFPPTHNPVLRLSKSTISIFALSTAIKKTLRTGFNTFVERDPSLNPSTNCTRPASITNYKCTLWGSGVDSASATNFGDYRGEFHVVITGSDGFQKTNTTTPLSQTGWQLPTQCGGDGSKAHNHPGHTNQLSAQAMLKLKMARISNLLGGFNGSIFGPEAIVH